MHGALGALAQCRGHCQQEEELGFEPSEVHTTLASGNQEAAGLESFFLR